MRRVGVEFACRYWFPSSNSNVDRTQWGWQRYREVLHVQIPGPGESTVEYLPPLFFGYNAAVTPRLRWDPMGDHTVFALEHYSCVYFQRIRWRETAMWSQVAFNPPNMERPNRGPWWLRWRTIDAPDDHQWKMYDYLSRQSDPEAEQLRREMTLRLLTT